MSKKLRVVLIGLGPVHLLALRLGLSADVSVLPLGEPHGGPWLHDRLFEGRGTPPAYRRLARQMGVALFDGDISAIDHEQKLIHRVGLSPIAFDRLSIELSGAPDLAILHGGGLVGPFRADADDAAISLAPFFTAQAPVVVGSEPAAGLFALHAPKPARLIVPHADAPLMGAPWHGWLMRREIVPLSETVVDLHNEGVVTASGGLVAADASLLVTPPLLPDFARGAPLVHQLDPFADCSALSVRQAAEKVRGLAGAPAQVRRGRVVQPLPDGEGGVRMFGAVRRARLFKRLADRSLDDLQSLLGAPEAAGLTCSAVTAVQENGEWPQGMSLYQRDGASAMQAQLLQIFPMRGFEPLPEGAAMAHAALAAFFVAGIAPEHVAVSLPQAAGAEFLQGLKQVLGGYGVPTAFAQHCGQDVAFALIGHVEPLRTLSAAGAKAGDGLVLVRDSLALTRAMADRAGLLDQCEVAPLPVRGFDALGGSLLALGATAVTLVAETGLAGALQHLAAASNLLLSVEPDRLPRPLWLARCMVPEEVEVEGRYVGPCQPDTMDAFLLRQECFPPAVLLTVAHDRLADFRDAMATLGEEAHVLGQAHPSLPGMRGGVALKEKTMLSGKKAL